MFDAKMDVRSLARRAVEALETIARHLGALAKTADLQGQILAQHQPLACPTETPPQPEANVHPLRPSLRSALGVKDNDR